MKLYRVVAYVLNLNGDCPDKSNVKNLMQNNRYPEFLSVREVQETDCGDWHDDHELNIINAPYEKYFPQAGNASIEDVYKELQRVSALAAEYGQQVEKLENQNYELKREVAQLKKVKEFLKTIRELTT
ncbi:MAG: hypothetical protein OIN85_01140 [Candidatus Methanoperedens sp.]|nr:hypothetical protein [Candidatus Methanoperedens sp.]